MLRGLVVMSLVSGAFATGYYFREHPESAPSILQQAKQVTTPKHDQSCEDDCEQTAIVLRAPEAQMKACKARCSGKDYKEPEREVPRSISVAPADHSRGLAPPPDRRIQRAK